ncbi:hypothetical protein SRABI123_02887 [Pseudomonas sp. Bi123]|nr:hypothetical protein SRABI123_02887 [Pseudomonas sp. Bi123]
MLEIAAGGAGDGGADSAAVVVDVIDRGFDRHAAGGLARFDGNDRAIAQGHGHWRAGRVGQGGGVGDLAAFSDGAGGAEAQTGVVDRVGNGGNGRGRVRHQVFEVAAGSAGDGGTDGAAVVVDVIGRGVDRHAAGGLARFDGNDRAIAQGHGHRRAGRVGQCGGVGDLAAFSDGAGGAEAQAGVVDRVGNGGDGRRGARYEVLEVAAGSAGDGGADGTAVVVDVIGRGFDIHGTGGFSGFDGDGRTVGQGDGDRRLRRVGQSGGVGDLATFSNAAGGGQGQAGIVDGIGNGGNGRGRVRHQVFEVAAGSAGDGGTDGAAVVVDVIGRGVDRHAAGGLARFDGNDRAIAQGHGHRRAGRVGQCGGVGDLAAFSDGAGGAEAQAGVVDRVGDGGDGRRGARYEVFEVAAGRTGDRGADGAAVVVNVIGRGFDIHGTGGFSGFDGDGRTVGQGDGDRRLRRVGQCGGVGDLATFSNAAGGGQGQAGIVDGIGNGGDGRGRVRHQVFEVAAGSAGDGGADGTAVVVDVVGRCRNVDTAGGVASSDGDGRTVGQGHGNRRLRRIGQGRGVGDLTAFGDSRASRQGDGGGVDGIGNGGDGRCRVRHQVLEVAAGSAGDGGADGAAVVVDVIGRRRHVHAAGGVSSGDGNG